LSSSIVKATVATGTADISAESRSRGSGNAYAKRKAFGVFDLSSWFYIEGEISQSRVWGTA